MSCDVFLFEYSKFNPNIWHPQYFIKKRQTSWYFIYGFARYNAKCTTVCDDWQWHFFTICCVVHFNHLLARLTRRKKIEPSSAINKQKSLWLKWEKRQKHNKREQPKAEKLLSNVRHQLCIFQLMLQHVRLMRRSKPDYSPHINTHTQTLKPKSKQVKERFHFSCPPPSPSVHYFQIKQVYIS